MDTHLQQRLYKSLIGPIFTYEAPIWKIMIANNRKFLQRKRHKNTMCTRHEAYRTPFENTGIIIKLAEQLELLFFWLKGK